MIWVGNGSGLWSGMNNTLPPVILVMILAVLGVFWFDSAAAVSLPESPDPSRPVTVIELFTSEGCSSCPPAEAKLSTLVDRDDILALAYHVDYWDYIGWADPFARPENTKRQRAYGVSLKNRTIYTPQMVFQGVFDTPGSRDGQINDGYTAALEVPRIPVSIVMDNTRIANIQIGASASASEGVVGDADADVLMVTYMRRAASEVTRGENAGRSLEHRNVVRSFERIGRWNNMAKSLVYKVPEAVTGEPLGYAILVQEVSGGRIIGAAALNLEN